MKIFLYIWILFFLQFHVIAQDRPCEHYSLYNLIFNQGIAQPYCPDSYPEIQLDSLERLTNQPTKDRIINTVKVFKSYKLNREGFDFLEDDTIKFAIPLLGKLNVIDLSYFLWACEANIYGEYHIIGYDRLDNFFCFSNKHEMISAFAALRVLKQTYSYKGYLDFNVYPKSSLEIGLINGDWIATKWNDENSKLKDLILQSYIDRYAINSDYYKILVQILTTPINNKSDWNDFLKLGETIIEPKLKVSERRAMVIDKYGMAFKQDYLRAYILRIVNSEFADIKSLEILNGVTYKDQFLQRALSFYNPELFKKYIEINYSTLDDYIELYNNKLNEYPYDFFLESLLYVKIIGNNMENISGKVDYFMNYNKK